MADPSVLSTADGLTRPGCLVPGRPPVYSTRRDSWKSGQPALNGRHDEADAHEVETSEVIEIGVE
jgi:hypothetical protein